MVGSDKPSALIADRPHVQRDRVVAALRRRILGGTYAAGAQLPAQRALIREFAVSPATFQRAMDRLVAFGLVETRGARGSFAPAQPATCRRIALMLPNGTDELGGNRFVSGLLRSARGKHHGRFLVYASGRTTREPGDGRRLLTDARDGLLAGMVFVFTPWYLAYQGLDDVLRLAVPRVVLAPSTAVKGNQRSTHLRVDLATVQQRLLRGFAAAGRRRCGVFAVHDSQLPAVSAAAQRAGLETRREWTHLLPLRPPAAGAAQAVARLLASKEPALRPDCLLILDDNHVPYVTAGLAEAGLGPGDLLIAAHANPPDITRAVLPCRRFGLDADAMLARAVAEIERLAGGAAPRRLVLPAGEW